MTDWPNPITNPEYYDPFASPDRNPELPTGLNSAPYNGDEMNGAGYNEPIWPMVFDTYEGYKPIIITDEFLDVFNGCPDLVIPCENNRLVIPREVRVQKVRRWA